MNDTMIYELSKEMLSSLRTISLKNAASHLRIDLSEAINTFYELENRGYLRIVKTKGCGSFCSSCSSCSSKTPPAYTGDEIIISLLYDRTDEYADD